MEFVLCILLFMIWAELNEFNHKINNLLKILDKENK